MTETPQQDRVDTEHLRDYSQLRRSVTDRKVAGVAGGLGRHLNIDPTILRVAFVVLAFFGGAGVLLYAALWAFVPEDGRQHAAVATSPSTRNAIIAVAAAIALLLVVGDAWGDVGFPWPIAIVALVAVFLVMNRDKPMSTTTPPPPPRASGTSAATDPTGSGVTSEPPVAGLPGESTASGTATQEPASYDWDPYGGALPPAPTSYPVQHAPAPRPDRGPKLFWFTIALLALALGSLGLYDVAAGGVAEAAYPALTLAVVGTMLLVGAWFGRPGGLIAVGVVAVLWLLGASASDMGFDDERVTATPASAAAVDDLYSFTAGATHLNLSRVEDLEGLDGRTIEIDGNVGEIVVTLPRGVDVDVSATVGGIGEITVMGETRNGVGGVGLDRSIDGGADVPAFDLDLGLVAGNIEVRQ